MSTAFVLGNGTSRQRISLEPLKQHGIVYGCNALYREFEPDHLVAVDAKMILEIAKSNWQMTHKVYTNHNKNFKDIAKLNILNPSKGWSSGPTALDLATEHGNENIFILGFDFKGTTGRGDKSDKVNNIYAGTLNYKRKTDPATYFGNWERQVGIILQRNSKTRYIRVVEDKDTFIPKSLKSFTNLTHITVDDFIKRFN
jgi:hypothetical protein